MAAEKLTAEELDKLPFEEVHNLTPEEQTEWMSRHMENWPAFVAGIAASHAELEVYRAVGGEGFPPGWITAREYRRQRALLDDH